MAITATNDGGSGFEPIAAGSYAARCYSMVHIGTVTGTFEGQEKVQNKVRITWELPTELKVFKEENGEQPMIISKEFTLSMHEKASLRKFLESWRGKGFTEAEAKSFDITQLLGKPCLVSILHKVKDGKTYAELSSVSTLPKGMVCDAQINPNFEFNYEPFDQDKFLSLPEWLRKKMETTPEYKKAIGFSPAQQDAMHGAEFEKQQAIEEEDSLPF
jgi:hypothetical protein